MSRYRNPVLNKLRGEWDALNAALQRMNQNASVKPDDPWSIFKEDEATPTPGTIKFELSPVVFNLPERSNDKDLDLFVVIEGWLELSLKDFEQNKALVTRNFSTKAAYFRKTSDGYDHVYGAHFDFALNHLGHPVFHGQLRPFPEMFSHVKEEYGVDAEAADLLKGILRTVRMPTAQMDFFSFFLQLVADHLLVGTNGPDERDAFNKLLEEVDVLKGAGYQANRLAVATAVQCFRARHWYPVVP